MHYTYASTIFTFSKFSFFLGIVENSHFSKGVEREEELNKMVLCGYLSYKTYRANRKEIGDIIYW